MKSALPAASVVACVLVVLFAPVAQAQSALGDKPTPAHESAAESPERAIALLKAAWEANDDAAIVARFAEPGASTLKRDLASQRKLEVATATLAKAVKDNLEGATLAVLDKDFVERHPTSPLAGTNVLVSVTEVKIDGDKATARVRMETLDADREQRISFVRRTGDWKIVLAGVDGVVLDDGALQRMLARAELREKTAAELEAIAKELNAGTLPSRDATRRRLAATFEKERAGVAKLAEDAAKAKRGGKALPPDEDDGDDE